VHFRCAFTNKYKLESNWHGFQPTEQKKAKQGCGNDILSTPKAVNPNAPLAVQEQSTKQRFLSEPW
jgi:hypothetical protein